MMNLKWVNAAFIFLIVLPLLLVGSINIMPFVQSLKDLLISGDAQNTAKLNKCLCGRYSNDKRIVGGNKVNPLRYPWMVRILFYGQYSCGGTLINDRYILTAAHCFMFYPTDITVQLLSNRATFMTRNILGDAIIHPKFETQTLNWDIALLKLANRVHFGPILYPICLHSLNKNYVGKMGTVIGYGYLAENGTESRTLQEVEMPIISNNMCANQLELNITSTMICAGYPDGMKDSCQGDSGGPMFRLERNIYYQIGIVSNGRGCARPNMPGIYTKVSKFRTWIQSNTADAYYCSKK